MLKFDRLAFLAMALHACGFMLAYELMQARPVPKGGLSTVAGAHLACVVLAALALPVLIGLGKPGRALICLAFLSAFATRLPGVDAWRDSVSFRAVMQMGQGALAASSYWVFFSLTPDEKWVRRYILSWLAGMAGKEFVLATANWAGGGTLPVLYIGVGAVFALLMITVSACVWGGTFSRPDPDPQQRPGMERFGSRTFLILAANTFLVAAHLGLLSGWVGPFHTMWADASSFAPRIAAPMMMMLVGWRLSRDFKAGFNEMTALCAMLCFAIATLAVVRRESVAVQGIPLLAVCCQAVFYACMTLTLVRMTANPRLFAVAVIVPYASMIFAGMATYETVPLKELDFSVVLLLCFVVFTVFHLSTRNIDFQPPLSPAATESAEAAEQAGRDRLERIYGHFGFSTREREVATWVARGLTVANIATTMHLSRHTINSHIRNMCEKAGISGREDLARLLNESPDDSRSERELALPHR